EWSLSDPAAWDFIRPILAENGGWAWFIFTPRGKNHAHDLYQMAMDSPDWYANLLTVDDTKAISPQVLERERKEYIARGMESRFLQEYYCSFDAANFGSIFGQEMSAIERSGRITNVPYNAAYPVETWWDVGLRDTTAIWFVQ